MKTFCIVAQGGGMTTAYHAGVIKALKEKFGFRGLVRVIASSGAAATYSYLISGQENLIQPIWQELVKSGKFVNPWKFPIGKGVMNIDFLIDEMIKRHFPLDLYSLKNNPIKFEVGVTDSENGKSSYFSKNDNVDFYELLRASCSVPYFSRPSVNLNGKNYYDGTIGSVSGLERVLDEENILLVLTRPSKPLTKLFFLRKILKWLLIRKETSELQETIWSMLYRYDKIPELIKSFQKNKNLVVIQPKINLPIMRIDTRLDKLTRTILRGYQDTIENKDLEQFFSKIF